GLIALTGFDEAALGDDIAEAVDHPGVGGQSVASGATGLLVVALDGARQVEVGDEADIGFVDAHAEGDRGDYDDTVLAEEPGLVLRADLGRQHSVIGQGGDAAGGERLGELVGTPSGEAVDDARVPGVLGGDEVQQLGPGRGLRLDPVGDVRPVEAGHEVLGTLEVEPLGEFGVGGRSGGGGQSDARGGRGPVGPDPEPGGGG